MCTQIVDNRHISVLYRELVDSIEIFSDKKNIIVDCTLGMAGHAIGVIEKMSEGDIFIGFDADIDNLCLAEKKLEKYAKSGIKIILINSNYVNLKQELALKGIDKITGIYYDLGLSSLHVDESERGFSFREEGPLDMRFDRTSGKTAADIVNGYTRDDLYKIFRQYGEEPASNKIATAIVNRRKKMGKFVTTTDLVEVIGEVTRHPKAKTRIFQAIRIEVNKELENLEKSLNNAIELLEKDGKIFVISFHSLEDRITKNILRRESRDCYCSDLICTCKHKKQIKILTKKPIIPSEEEQKMNSRSRSAKARLAVKI
ncbi:MAG: 16S rRNA (cytosine(1402)-N(4))-methyltransferase RsmH [Candidatus Gracilibacteria bacterium]|nr:16S rRNA (cytosine(1402)-N(4))-methyltransferase RsmH [Candidatus Gracilibacteria bacterium]